MSNNTDNNMQETKPDIFDKIMHLPGLPLELSMSSMVNGTAAAYRYHCFLPKPIAVNTS